jgi:hypothetical protein
MNTRSEGTEVTTMTRSVKARVYPNRSLEGMTRMKKERMTGTTMARFSTGGAK